MDKKRLKTLLILSFMFSIFMIWDTWQRARNPAPAAAAATAMTATDGSVPTAPATAGAVPTATGNKATLPGADTAKVTIKTDVMVAEVSAQGGDIVSVELLKHRATIDASKNFMLLQNGGEHIYVAQSGLIGDGLPNHKTLFDLGKKSELSLDEGQDKVELRLSAPAANGLKVTKVYTFTRGSYVIDVSYELNNTSAISLSPMAYFQIVRDGKEPENHSSGAMAFGATTFTGPALYTEADKYQKVPFDKIMKNEAKFTAKADNGWIALVQHYFFSAWLPQGKMERSFYMDKMGDNLYRTGLKFPIESIAPGATTKLDVPFYAGPQEQDKLEALAPGLDHVVDYGSLTIIASPLFWVMEHLHAMLGNWGWTIIVLTIMLKLAFFPLSAAGYKSMARMRVVTPMMAKLKDAYKDDKSRLNQEMMALYKREKINPLGGCLPMLVQIPVFIALYWVLLATVEMRGAPWLGWITDLSVKDPYYVLPLLMGATMFFQARLNPAPPDPIQAKVMLYMPLLFTVMFLWFPSGLTLYWVVNNLLSIAQQWYITKQAEQHGSASK